jgi:opine dehydrogenase
VTETVAVLGGSHGAHAAAADLALAGHRVRLWRRSKAALADLAAAGTLTLEAEGRAGVARLERVTSDLGEALDGAGLVLVPLPAFVQDDLAAACAPHLRDDQIVWLTPGTLGTWVFARAVARAGGTLPFALAESGTLPYLTRKVGPTRVRAPVRAANLPTGVLPASRTDPVLARLAALFPSVRQSADALDAALTNAGIVIHPPLVLLNAGAIEAGRFDIHAAGTTPGILRVIHAMDAERVRLREALGYPPPHYEIATYYDEARAAEGLYGTGAKAKLVASGLWDERLTFGHRYVTEDVALGLVLYVTLGRALAVPTPAMEAVLGCFRRLLPEDPEPGGRSLARLGLDGLGPPALRELFARGWESPRWAAVLSC